MLLLTCWLWEVSGQLLYDFSKGCKGQVDVLELSQMLAAHLLLLVDLLRASEVSEVELAPFDHAVLINRFALQEKLEDRVRPRAVHVHLGVPGDSVLDPSGENSEAVYCVLDNVLAKALNVDALPFVFSDD